MAEEQLKMLLEQAAANAPAASHPTAGAVTIQTRLSDFWINQPRLWFHQFEAVMAPQKPGDLCKYQLVIAKLGREELSQVSDILENPPEHDKYDVLKARLISTYEESETMQLQKLLTEIELGDQRPSQLLRKMKELGRNKVQEETIKLLWLKRLPNTVKAVIAACNKVELDDIALIADKIMEQSSTELHNINSAPSTSSSSPSIHEQIAILSQEIAAMGRRFQSHQPRRQQYYTQSRYRSRSTSRERARDNQSKYRAQRAKPGDTNFKCFYHYIFGDEATKCGDVQCSNKSLN